MLYIKRQRWITDFSSEAIQAKRQWGNICKVLEEKHCQPRILQVAKMSSFNQSKMFSDIQKLKDASQRPTGRRKL